ncbi:MAG: hypothetical protein KF768_14035 [Phycisphaeraceae bacterium]|nr:hypothetical protein [Phycisphaeraceae bacterium]
MNPTEPTANPAPARPTLDNLGLPIGYPFKPDWEVTPRQVRDGLGEGTKSGMIVVDCRRPEEHQHCRIEGTAFIPLSELEQRADELEADDGSRDHPVVIYCHTGRRSLRAAAALRALGYPRAVSMAGGIDLWSIDIDPNVPRY